MFPGSCADAGYKGCCTEGKCDGTISSTPFGFCHCDDICHAIGDCCNDIVKINCTRKGEANLTIDITVIVLSGKLIMISSW